MNRYQRMMMSTPSGHVSGPAADMAGRELANANQYVPVQLTVEELGLVRSALRAYAIQLRGHAPSPETKAATEIRDGVMRRAVEADQLRERLA